MTGTLAPVEPTPTRARRLVRAGAYALLVGAVLFGVGALVRSRWDPLMSLDDALIERATSVTRPRPGLREALIVWQELTQPLNLYIVGTLVCLWVWLAKGLRTRAWWAFGTMMLAWMIGLGAKYLFERARPIVEDPVSESPGYSFPSGHALNSAAWATIMVILLWPVVRSRVGHAVMVVLAVLFIATTALDRVFLGVHYPSDVTVGVLTGVGLALASYAGYAGWNPPHPTHAHDPDDPEHPEFIDDAGPHRRAAHHPTTQES